MTNPSVPKYQKDHIINAIEDYIHRNKTTLTVSQLQRWFDTLKTVQEMKVD